MPAFEYRLFAGRRCAPDISVGKLDCFDFLTSVLLRYRFYCTACMAGSKKIWEAVNVQPTLSFTFTSASFYVTGGKFCNTGTLLCCLLFVSDYPFSTKVCFQNRKHIPSNFDPPHCLPHPNQSFPPPTTITHHGEHRRHNLSVLYRRWEAHLHRLQKRQILQSRVPELRLAFSPTPLQDV